MYFFPKHHYLRIFFFLIGGIFLASCNDPDDIIGLDVQPPGDKINLVHNDTTKVTAYTVREDSLRTDEVSLFLLGSYRDSVFGRTDAGIYAQALLPNSNVNLGDSLGIDSCVLTLRYSGQYGDTFPAAQVFHVYKLTEDMHLDSGYYSNRAFSYDPAEVDSATITPELTDSVLRIRLSNQFGSEFLTMSDNSELSDNAEFLTYFKGFYIKTDPVNNGGGIFYFNLLASQSKLTVYYHSGADDSLSFSFVFTTESARMTHFDHDYSASPIQQQLNDSTHGDTLVYVQAMAGVKTKIRFPNLKNLIAGGGMVAVNKAELELTVTNNSDNRLAVPDKLLVLGVDAEGKAVFIADQFESTSYYGGSYSSTDRKYKFNIARYVQDVLKGTADYGLYLAVSGGAVQGNRVILGGATNSAYRMKLNLFVTKPN